VSIRQLIPCTNRMVR